jgi:hypothetical protein
MISKELVASRLQNKMRLLENEIVAKMKGPLKWTTHQLIQSMHMQESNLENHGNSTALASAVDVK